MSYFDIIMQFWREGRIIEAKRLFDQCKEYRNLTEDEEERLGKLFPNPYEQLKELLESPTPELIYMVYQELTRRTKWDEDMLMIQLNISRADLEEIKELESGSKRIAKRLVTGYLGALYDEVMVEIEGREGQNEDK